MKPTLALFALLSLAGCAAIADSGITVAHPSHDPIPTPTRVSVFGLFNGGRLDEDAWKRVAPIMAAAVGNDCTLGYGDALRDADADLYDKIDHDAEDTGVTDTILHSVDAHATGNLVLALNSAGQLQGQGASMAARSVERASTNGGRYRGPVGGAIDDSQLQITAILYSVEHHETLMTIELDYSGHSIDDAFKKVAAKLKALVPDATCASWKWK